MPSLIHTLVLHTSHALCRCVQAVWAVLTDYNRLAEFIPNLAVSQRIALPPSAPPNIIRVRQVRAAGWLWADALGSSQPTALDD